MVDTSKIRYVEVCEHGLPLGWACSREGCNERTIGTRPAKRANPPQFRDSRFVMCGHDDLEEEACAPLLEEIKQLRQLLPGLVSFAIAGPTNAASVVARDRIVAEARATMEQITEPKSKDCL